MTPTEFIYGVMDNNRNEEIFEKSGIEIGDYVRVRIEKSIFQKGSTQKWSNEVYKVIERNGYGFKLEGERKVYKPRELLKIESSEPERLKTTQRTQTRDKQVIDRDKVKKKVMRELGITEQEAENMMTK